MNGALDSQADGQRRVALTTLSRIATALERSKELFDTPDEVRLRRKLQRAIAEARPRIENAYVAAWTTAWMEIPQFTVTCVGGLEAAAQAGCVTVDNIGTKQSFIANAQTLRDIGLTVVDQAVVVFKEVFGKTAAGNKAGLNFNGFRPDGSRRELEKAFAAAPEILKKVPDQTSDCRSR